MYFTKVVSFLYVDDGCFLNPSSKYTERAIFDLMDSKKSLCKFDLEDHGVISFHLGINFTDTKYGNFKLTQTHLIDQVIVEIGL